MDRRGCHRGLHADRRRAAAVALQTQRERARQGARIDGTTLSPVQPMQIFMWKVPHSPGTSRFCVTVVARGGKTAVAEWSHARR
jgi:hypothetical protein